MYGHDIRNFVTNCNPNTRTQLASMSRTTNLATIPDKSARTIECDAPVKLITFLGGSYLAAVLSGNINSVLVYHVETGDLLRTIKVEGVESIDEISGIQSDESTVFVLVSGSTLKIVDYESGEAKITHSLSDSISSKGHKRLHVTSNEAGVYDVIVALQNGRMEGWKLSRDSSDKYLEVASGHSDQMQCVVDANVLVTGGKDGNITLWEHGKERASVEAHEGGVTAMCVAGERNIVVSGGEDAMLHVWNCSTLR